MDIAVVICTHNRRELLARTIASLNHAQRPKKCGVSFLVIANACSDDTVPWLEQYRRSAVGNGLLPLEYSEEIIAGKSNALNHAAPLIRAQITTFVDDDHRVDTNYLVGICRAMQEYPETALFCGRIFPDWGGSEPAWVYDTGPYRIYPLPVPRFDLGAESRSLTPEVATPGGGNLFLRTEWLAKVGPFSTDLGPTGHDLDGAEDLDWVRRALGMGAKLRYVPEVLQYHYVDPQRLTLPYLMKKAYKRTASTVRLAHGGRQVEIPRYLYRKVIGYILSVLGSLGHRKRRFFLVRTSAALGEIAGYRQLRKHVRVVAPTTMPSKNDSNIDV